MTWCLALIADMWRLRWRFGLPIMVGALGAVVYTLSVPPTYVAEAKLQVQSEQARSPMLRKIDAPGQQTVLRQFASNPQLLADTGKDLHRPIDAGSIGLKVLNEHLISLSYSSTQRDGLEQVTDSLAYNFIQSLLAPERMRIEQLILQNQQELQEIAGRLATTDGKDAIIREQMVARQDKVQTDTIQLQSDLRSVNLAFGSNGSQALIWFADPATLIPPMDAWARMVSNVLFGMFLGALYGWLVYEAPRKGRRVIRDGQEAGEASGMPLVGILPWLGKLKMSPNGLFVKAGGKQLKPSEFSELGRLQRTLVRTLRGPLVLLGVQGSEGTSSLAFMLAERTAAQGKTVALVDMNLKDRMLSQWLGLGDGNWELPKGKKGRWEALHPVPGHANLRVLAAPRHPETLTKLGEAGGLPVLFDLLATQADVVIVDASPMAAMNRGNVDAVAVAAASARTVLIAQAGVTPAGDLKRAADGLLLVGAPLLGVLLNQRFSLTRRQLLGQLADRIGMVLPPLAKALRKATLKAKLD